MRKFEIVYYPNEDDVKGMIQLDGEAFCELDRGELNKCLEWKKICPDVYTAIKLDAKVIGYINFIAVTKKCYYRMKVGKLKDYELKSEDILPFKKGENYCLFMSVVIEKKFRDTEVVIRLSNAFFEKIYEMKKSGIMVDNILCDCVSKDGEKFIKENFSVKYICNSKNGTKIYEFKL